MNHFKSNKISANIQKVDLKYVTSRSLLINFMEKNVCFIHCNTWRHFQTLDQHYHLHNLFFLAHWYTETQCDRVALFHKSMKICWTARAFCSNLWSIHSNKKNADGLLGCRVAGWCACPSFLNNEVSGLCFSASLRFTPHSSASQRQAVRESRNTKPDPHWLMTTRCLFKSRVTTVPPRVWMNIQLRIFPTLPF